MAKMLLEGIKVVDFSRVIVGPLTSKILCDYGAEVIKIESQHALDLFRTNDPDPDLSAHFTQWNTGKLSVTLNLVRPKALEVVKRIISRSDVVIEAFTAGTMDRLGLGYKDLKEVKPDIIMLSTCMQGQTGPFAGSPGFGFQMIALSGINHITGWPDREPPEVGPYTDFIVPNYAIAAILSALIYRRRTGKGQYIDISQFETAVQFMSPLVLEYMVNKRTANRMGNRLDFAAPHNAYRCKDEYTWCSIPPFTQEAWEKFCSTTDNQTWANDLRFSSIRSRGKNQTELDKLISEWTADRTFEEIKTALQTINLAVDRLPTGLSKPGHNAPGIYRCKNLERWCAISVFTNEEWNSFCDVIGRPSLAQNPKYSTLLTRKENEDTLDSLVEKWTIKHRAEEVMNLMQAAGVAAGILETGEDQLKHDPQIKHRNLFPELNHPRLGKHHAIASPFKLSKSPCQLKTAPLLGEHNEYVLKNVLGMSDDEVAELIIDGALE